jgi:hypothetical protein
MSSGRVPILFFPPHPIGYLLGGFATSQVDDGGFIYRTRSGCPTDVPLMLYIIFINPRLVYWRLSVYSLMLVGNYCRWAIIGARGVREIGSRSSTSPKLNLDEELFG